MPLTGDVPANQNLIVRDTASVAAAPDGRFVVAYYDSAIDAASPLVVRLFAADGTPLTGEIHVNQDTSPALDRPGVAMDAQGDFVVTWANYIHNPGGGLDLRVISARRFDATGASRGDEFQVSQNTDGKQFGAVVAMDGQGDFTVVWNGLQGAGSLQSIRARRYSAAGVALGDEFNVTTAGPPLYPAAAMDPAGDLVIAWSHTDTAFTATVYAQTYDVAGAVRASAFPVSQSTVNEQYTPAVATDSTGDFVVAWANGPLSGPNIYARRFTAAGAALTDEIQVNQWTLSNNGSPRVASDAQGDFVVSWENSKGFPYRVPSANGDDAALARAYSASGQDLSGEFVVGASATAPQDSVDVAMDARGDFIAAWSGVDSAGLAAIDTRRFAASTSGFTYDAATRTVGVAALGGNSTFAYSQLTVNSQFTGSGGPTRLYTFAINGVPLSYTSLAVARASVAYAGAGNTAVLHTDDTYVGTDNQTHETSEAVSLGQGGGTIYQLDPSGNGTLFLQMAGFDQADAFLGAADYGQIVASAGMANTFVSAGHYAYMNSGADFYYITGAASVYGLAVNAGDVAYHYDGSGPSQFLASGVAYSFMQGTDNGRSFYNEADGFRFNYGIATHSGDTATIYDSPMTDVFAGYSSYSYLYADNPDGTLAEYDYVQGFGSVNAYSFVGGIDYASVADPNVNHVYGFQPIV
jgi:hypothetical protein